MSKPYPFNTFADMWPYVSQLDVEFDIDRMHSRLLLAKKDVESVIGESTYKLINDHFWAEQTEPEAEPEEGAPTQEQLDELLGHLQGVMANFAVYRQYIWMVMRVSSDGISQRSGDEYKPVSQSMSQEAKNDLINSAWMFIDGLIKDLNKYEVEEWVEYKTQVPILLLFSDTKEFNRYFVIDSNNYFFELLRPLIEEIENDKVKSRFNVQDISAIDDKILYNIKKAVAFDAMAEAVFRFDYHTLPAPIRHDIDRAGQTRGADKNSDFIKEKLKYHFATKAESYYKMANDQYAEKTATNRSEPDFNPTGEITYSEEADKFFFG